MSNHQAFDEYLKKFPDEVQKKLIKMMETIKEVIPEAEEEIVYGIPTFRVSGKNLVHIGGFTHHVSFFPTPSAIEHFASELKEFETSKGAIKFPLDKPIPYALISKITKWRVGEMKIS